MNTNRKLVFGFYVLLNQFVRYLATFTRNRDILARISGEIRESLAFSFNIG